MNSEYSNFLLIDDDIDYNSGKNAIAVPEICFSNSNDDVLLQLIPLLKKWNKYTNIDKIGNTQSFFKSINGKPQFN